MSNHSPSKELLLVSIFGALAGGAITIFLTSKKGKKVIHRIEGDFEDITSKIKEVVYELEQSLEKNVSEKTEEWTSNIREILEQIKERIDSADLNEPQNLTMIRMSIALLEILLGLITSRVSKAGPLLKELHHLIAKNRGTIENEKISQVADKADNLIEFALLGLKVWNKIKHHRR